MSKNQLIKELRIIDGLCDPWQSALSMHFAICDELYFRDPNLVPNEWQYSPGMIAQASGDPREMDSYEAELCLNEPTEVLIQAGNILERYENLLKKHGKDY